VTGHICNTKSLFTGELIPSTYKVGSATGVSTPTLMGTVVFRITDNDGGKHLFTMKNVNYLPDSPVDDTINSLKERLCDLAGKNSSPLILKDDGGIIFTEGNRIMVEAPLTLTNLVSFFNGMHL
jgi:hypothetical protein